LAAIPENAQAKRRMRAAVEPVQRRFTRFQFDGQARIFSSTAMWETEVIDLSLRGVLMRRPDNFDGKTGNNYRIELRLAGSAIISMAVTLANQSADTLGLRAEHLDWNSFLHLKRLIELNLGDSDSLYRELSALG
jgi:hypothetical protein